MAMTTSQLSIVVKSQGVEKAADDLVKLAKAASSVDAETKAFVIAQQKLDAANTKTSKSSELLEVRISRQKQAMEAANIRAERLAAASANLAAKQEMAANSKLAKELERQEQASMRAAAAMENQERQMVKQHMQALKMNDAYDKHAKGLDEVTRRGNVYVNTLRSMATAALAYVGVNFFTDVVKQADAWSLMQSKLSLAVGGMDAAKRAQTDLYDISQRLRVPIEDTTKLFTRMSVPLQKMGKGIIDTKEVVTSFSTALKLAGATGQEASSAMLQFSQSLNAGRLNGGEFNSIAEASPNVLRAIEVELVRVGRGAELSSRGLKKMAADGKLSTDVLVEALQRAAPKWNKEFETLPLTVDGAMTRIKNAWQKAIGEVGQDTKFNEKMAESLKKLEDMLPNIARLIGNTFTFLINNGDKLLAIFTGLGIVITGLKIGTMVTAMQAAAMAINATTGAAAGLRGALLAIGITPVGLAVTALGVALGALYLTMGKFAESSSKAEKESRKLIDASAKLSKESDNENYYLSKQISLLDKAALSQEELNRLKLEGLATGSQSRLSAAADILQKAEIDFMKAKKAWDDVKGNNSIGDSGKFREFKAAEDAMKVAQDAFSRMKDSEAQITEKRLKEQSLLQKKSRNEYEEEIKRSSLTERQLLETKYNEEVKATEDKHKKLQNSEASHQLALSTIKRKYLEDLSKLDKKVKPKEDVNDIPKMHKEIDTREMLTKSVEDYVKVQTKQEEVAQSNLNSVQAELANVNALIEGYGEEKKSLVDLEIIKATAALNAQSNVVRTAKEIFDLTERVRLLKELKGQQANLSGMDSAKKAMDDMFDKSKVDKWESATAKAMKGAVKGVVDLTKAFEKYSAKKAALKVMENKGEEVAKQYGKDSIEHLKYQDELQRKSDDYKLASYAEMADAAKNFFNEGSKGYQALDAVSKIFHAAQMARTFMETSALAVKGVVNQAGGDVYTAIPRMAAMAAIMAALGYATGAFGSSGSGGMKAEDVQKTQGTGSVFGDSEAKSESIKNSLDLLKSSYDKLYPVNQGMLKALKNIESSMTGLSNLVLRSGGVIEGSNMGIATGQLNAKGSAVDPISRVMTKATEILLPVIGSGVAKFINNLWGKTTQNIIDSGVQFGGSLSEMQAGKGFNQYASVDTTKSSWFGLKKSTSNSIQTQGLNDELSSQFGLVFTNMQKSLEEAGKALYGSSEGVTKALESLVISTSKISLKGLTGDALSNAINAVISKGLDEMAEAAFANFDQYRMVGEGYAQTIMRVANNFVTVNAVFDKLGMKLLETSDAGIKASDSFIKLFDSLEEMQSVAAEYYDKFYTEQEKQAKITEALKKQFADMNLVLPDSAKAYRELVDSTTDPEKIATLWKLSGAFAEVFGTIEQSAKELPQVMKDAFESLSSDAQRWLSIRNQAASLKDSISAAMGNPQKDPAIRMQQLWDAMSKDITPEQKLALAGELKDLTLAKYQLEKDSMSKLIDFGKQLKGYVEGLKLGALSPLTVGQKLAEAQAQYQSTLAKAQAGDTNAQGALSGKADAYLSIAQTALASSGGYIDIFNSVTGSLDALGVESMSAAEQANSIASGQLEELQRLSDFISGIETTANSYYNSSLIALSTQITLMDAMYQKMGIFDGMLASIAGLPAEIAASLSGSATASVSNDKFIRDLYQSVEGKVGSQVDQAGYQYWMKDLQTQTREQVGNNFVMASAQNAQAGTMQNNTAALETQISELSLEIKGLREDQNKQTGASIDAALITSANSTQAIVEAIREVNKSDSWDSQVRAELV